MCVSKQNWCVFGGVLFLIIKTKCLLQELEDSVLFSEGVLTCWSFTTSSLRLNPDGLRSGARELVVLLSGRGGEVVTKSLIGPMGARREYRCTGVSWVWRVRPWDDKSRHLDSWSVQAPSSTHPDVHCRGVRVHLHLTPRTFSTSKRPHRGFSVPVTVPVSVYSLRPSLVVINLRL